MATEILTDAEVRNAQPRAKPYKLNDGGGLYLLVKPKGPRKERGSKLWRFKYRYAERERLLAIGAYPDVTLEAARDERQKAVKLLKAGRDPVHQRRVERLRAVAESANTFEAVARDWMKENRPHWTQRYSEQVAKVLENHVFRALGPVPVRDIEPADIHALVKQVKSRGVRGKAAPTIALLIRQWAVKIFEHAIAERKADRNPARDVAAPKRPAVRHIKKLERREIPVLVERLMASEALPETKIALRLLLYTFVRPGELRGARWTEFDLDHAEWRIPAERMKRRREHVVPLSRQAVALLRELHARTGEGEFLFPHRDRPADEPMGATTMNRTLEYIGYAGAFSAHGFRSTASTLLNEMGFNPDWIERQLAHKERNATRAAYNRAEHLPERRKMLQQWADFIDGLKAGDNVEPLKAKAAA